MPPDRDRRILDQVARYRLTTVAVVRATLLPAVQSNAVTKVLARLVRSGHLRAFPYVGPRTYFVLSPAAARRCGVGRAGPPRSAPRCCRPRRPSFSTVWPAPAAATG